MKGIVSTLLLPAVVFLAFFLSLNTPIQKVLAHGTPGSVRTVLDCSHTNDNSFTFGQTVKGKYSNLDDNNDYRWTIVKVDNPSQGTQVANGSFHLGNNDNSGCITIWNSASCTGGDNNSEYKWEVEKKTSEYICTHFSRGHCTSGYWQDDWDKVDSDNFSVSCIQPTLTPTVIPSPTPTDICEPKCEWSEWSDCTVSCGGGLQYRYFRGEGCSNAEESRACNEQACEGEPSITPTPSPIPTETEVVEQSRGGTSEAGAPVCNDIVPPSPSILSAIYAGSNSVKLTWTKVSPANSYSILYGTRKGDYPYSVFSTGNTDNYVINGISAGCFAVKAVNGCMPGGLSAEVCTGQVAGAVLGASTLGATGGFASSINDILIALGSILTGLGIKKSFFKK